MYEFFYNKIKVEKKAQTNTNLIVVNEIKRKINCTKNADSLSSLVKITAWLYNNISFLYTQHILYHIYSTSALSHICL